MIPPAYENEKQRYQRMGVGGIAALVVGGLIALYGMTRDKPSPIPALGGGAVAVAGVAVGRYATKKRDELDFAYMKQSIPMNRWDK
jgi:hypothetical protein